MQQRTPITYWIKKKKNEKQKHTVKKKKRKKHTVREEQQQQKAKKNEESLCELQDAIKRYDLQIIKVKDGKESEEATVSLFKKIIMVENFPNPY